MDENKEREKEKKSPKMDAILQKGGTWSQREGGGRK